jgi:hypothetical protein
MIMRLLRGSVEPLVLLCRRARISVAILLERGRDPLFCAYGFDALQSGSPSPGG